MSLLLIMSMENTETIITNPELKSELLHALFALKNLHFHRLGQGEFSMGGVSRRKCAQSGKLWLNIPEFALLQQLKLREERGESGGAWLAQMGEYLRVSKAAVSQMLGALERRGLITREPDPGNRRTIIVKLTEKGNEMIDDFEREFDSYIVMFIERFGEKDTREIIRLIYKFMGIVEEIPKNQNGSG